MLIQSLKQHFPARFPEWLMSGVMTTWGAYLLLHPEMLTDPPGSQVFAGLAAFGGGKSWGLVTLIVGVVRACALFVNGAWTRTPLIRLITSFISGFLFAQIAWALFMGGTPNTGVAVYPWLFFCDMASAYRAALDTKIAERNRQGAIDGGSI